LGSEKVYRKRAWLSRLGGAGTCWGIFLLFFLLPDHITIFLRTLSFFFSFFFAFSGEICGGIFFFSFRLGVLYLYFVSSRFSPSTFALLFSAGIMPWVCVCEGVAPAVVGIEAEFPYEEPVLPLTMIVVSRFLHDFFLVFCGWKGGEGGREGCIELAGGGEEDGISILDPGPADVHSRVRQRDA